MATSDEIHAELMRRQILEAQQALAPKQYGSGRIINGAFSSPEWSTNDPALVARIQAGEEPSAVAKSSVYGQVVDQNAGSSRAASFLRGVPFVGSYFDEAADAIGLDGGQITLKQDAMADQKPVQDAALRFAGGVAGLAPMAAMGVPSAVAAMALPGRVIAGAAAGTAGGALEGAVYGSGEGRGAERFDNAIAGGWQGGIIGGVTGAGGVVLGAGVKAALQSVKGSDLAAVAATLGVSKGAARVIRAALENDDFEAAAAQLARSDKSLLGEAGPGTNALLDAAAQTPGRGAAAVRDAVTARTDEAAATMGGELDRILGVPTGVKTAARGIAARTASVRQAAYQRAYARHIDYTAYGSQIEGVLARIPPKTLKAAVDEANDAMREAGTGNFQIMASIAADGSVTFTQPLNVQQLDEVKKALGNYGREAVDPFGRPTAQGLRANRLAGDLRDALTQAVPDYGRAVRLGGDKIAEDRALELGRDLLSPAMTRETAAAGVQNLSVEAKTALMQGLRGRIDDTLANVARTMTDPNIDARELMKVVKDMSSRAARTKVEMAIGMRRANELFAALDKATTALELKAAVAQNSKTAPRAAIQGQVAREASPNALQSLLGGEGVSAAKRVIAAMTGETADARTLREQGLFSDIAAALTRVSGPEAQRALSVMQRAIAGQKVTDTQATWVAKLIARPTALGAYQSGRPAQTR